MEDLAAAVGDGNGGPGPGAGVRLGVELDEEALEALRGKPAIYHCISRVVGGEFLLGPAEREHFVKLMRAYEAFGHLRILTYCVLSNHFHILVEVPARPEEDPDDEELLAHLGGLYSPFEMAGIRWELEHYRAQDNERGAEALRQRYLSRMWDLSAFMKILKQRFTQWFNPQSGRHGTLWEERFKSLLVEDGHAARVVAAYIDLNPVRAGMVEDPRSYRWSGYGEAVAGRKVAREGLQRMMFEYEQMRGNEAVAAREVADWRRVAAGYRQILYMDGGEGPETEESGGGGGETGTRRRKGFTRKEVEAVLAKGGKLSEGEILGGRVRYFIDGVMVGTKEFVENSYRLSRERFGPKRTTGARRMRGVESELHTARALQVDALGS